MGFLPIAMGAASLLGGIGGRKAEKENAANNMEANAEAIRYSPWTHMQTQMQQAQAPKGSAIGDLGAGILSGISQQQNMDSAAAQKGLLNSQKNYYDAAAFNSALPKGPPSLAQSSPGIGWAGMFNKYQNQG